MPGPAPQAPANRLTPAQFAAWKAAQDAARQQAEAARAAEVAAGAVALEELTGKELFDTHPELFEDY
jgi:hypothetical protein